MGRLMAREIPWAVRQQRVRRIAKAHLATWLLAQDEPDVANRHVANEIMVQQQRIGRILLRELDMDPSEAREWAAQSEIV